ncbi:MAG TPA: inositol monophosphatase family protein [Haliangiales bacterium]|nr:inositol monophosphatase family protein [Haliangiales bacterium]
MPLSPEQALAVALAVGESAGRALRDGWGHVGEVRHKELATDLVTEWDTRIERLVHEELARRSPGEAILGEELGGRAAPEGTWIVDPVDGTVNFAHGLPLFSVSIAYEAGGAGLAGVVVAPALGWTFAAAKGRGATWNGAPLAVSATATLAEAMVVTGFPYDRHVSPRNNFAAWEHLQRVAGAVRRLGAASLDLCFVAAGWLDAYWEFKLKPWDLAAGAVIATEAGGRVTDLGGGPFASAAGEILATNGRIHDEMIEALRGRT